MEEFLYEPGTTKWVIGADEVFNRPSPTPDRLVFDFRDSSITDASTAFPRAFSAFRDALGRSVKDSDLRWSHPAKELFNSLRPDREFLVISSGGATHHMIARLPGKWLPTHKLVAFTFYDHGAFCTVQNRVHELWANSFSTTFGGGDAATYNPTQTCQTFPFPVGFESDPALEAAGAAYHAHRAALMVEAGEGMTKTYNRFHDPDERSAPIAELRRLHDAMDHAVLTAYEWSDLTPRAVPAFEPLYADDEEPTGRARKKWRLRWPEPVREDVLARLLALNADRAAAEAKAGPLPKKKRG